MKTVERAQGRTGAFLLLASGMAVFGSGAPTSKVITGAFPVFLASGLRLALAVALLWPLLIHHRAHHLPGNEPLRSMGRRDWLILGGIAVGGMFLFSIFMLYGMKHIGGAVAGVVMATTPAVTAVGSVLFLGDRLDRWKSLGIAAAVAGILALNLGGAGGLGEVHNLWLGTALVFGAVCGEASYTLLGKRLTATMSPVAVATLAGALGAALFAPLAFYEATTFDWGGPSAAQWGALAWWGAGVMGLGSLLWYRGVQRVTGSTAAGFMGVMPLSALLISYLVLGEAFSWVHLAGATGVLLGIAAVARGHAEPADEPSEPAREGMVKR